MTKSMWEQLEFTAVEKSAPATRAASQDPKVRVRDKFLTALAQQREHAEAVRDGKDYKRTGVRYVGKGEERKSEEREVRLKPWFFEEAGTYYTELRYSTSLIPGPNGATSIKAGKNIGDVIKIYDLVEKGAKAGELDDVLVKIASERGAKRKGGDAEEAAGEQPKQGAAGEKQVTPNFKKAAVSAKRK